jgi:hypothetical protein
VSDDVVGTWRGRGVALGRQGWRCAGCGRIALVRRVACVGCGAAEQARAALPAAGTIRATSAAGAAVEHLDQVTGRRPAAWLELDGGGALPCLLGHPDGDLPPAALRGRRARLAIRRAGLGPTAPADPIAYGIKAVLDLETRAAIKTELAAAKAAKDRKE